MPEPGYKSSGQPGAGTHAQFPPAPGEVEQQVDVQSPEQLVVLLRSGLGELLQGVREAVVRLLDAALLVQGHAVVIELVEQGEPVGGGKWS